MWFLSGEISALRGVEKSAEAVVVKIPIESWEERRAERTKEHKREL